MLAAVQLAGTLLGFGGVVLLVSLLMFGQRRDAAYWWLALAMLVSGVVDVLGYVVSVDASKRLSDLYPVLQSAIIAGVFLTRTERQLVTACLVFAGVCVVLLGHPGLDVGLASIASLVVCGIVYDHPEYGHLRTSLLVSFGATLLVLLASHVYPHPPMGVLYHGTRALGLALFCMAVLRPLPKLRVA